MRRMPTLISASRPVKPIIRSSSTGTWVFPMLSWAM
jgi:hypothetical protein